MVCTSKPFPHHDVCRFVLFEGGEGFQWYWGGGAWALH